MRLTINQYLVIAKIHASRTSVRRQRASRTAMVVPRCTKSIPPLTTIPPTDRGWVGVEVAWGGVVPTPS